MKSFCCKKEIVIFGKKTPGSTNWYGCSQCFKEVNQRVFKKIIKEKIELKYYDELKA